MHPSSVARNNSFSLVAGVRVSPKKKSGSAQSAEEKESTNMTSPKKTASRSTHPKDEVKSAENKVLHQSQPKVQSDPKHTDKTGRTKSQTPREISLETQLASCIEKNMKYEKSYQVLVDRDVTNIKIKKQLTKELETCKEAEKNSVKERDELREEKNKLLKTIEELKGHLDNKRERIKELREENVSLRNVKLEAEEPSEHQHLWNQLSNANAKLKDELKEVSARLQEIENNRVQEKEAEVKKMNEKIEDLQKILKDRDDSISMLVRQLGVGNDLVVKNEALEKKLLVLQKVIQMLWDLDQNLVQLLKTMGMSRSRLCLRDTLKDVERVVNTATNEAFSAHSTTIEAYMVRLPDVNLHKTKEAVEAFILQFSQGRAMEPKNRAMKRRFPSGSDFSEDHGYFGSPEINSLITKSIKKE